MKKLQLLIASTLIAASVTASAMSESSVRYSVKCVDGHKFLFTWSSSSNNAASVVQIFKTVDDTKPPQPIQCRGK